MEPAANSWLSTLRSTVALAYSATLLLAVDYCATALHHPGLDVSGALTMFEANASAVLVASAGVSLANRFTPASTPTDTGSLYRVGFWGGALGLTLDGLSIAPGLSVAGCLFVGFAAASLFLAATKR